MVLSRPTKGVGRWQRVLGTGLRVQARSGCRVSIGWLLWSEQERAPGPCCGLHTRGFFLVRTASYHPPNTLLAPINPSLCMSQDNKSVQVVARQEDCRRKSRHCRLRPIIAAAAEPRPRCSGSDVLLDSFRLRATSFSRPASLKGIQLTRYNLHITCVAVASLTVST